MKAFDYEKVYIDTFWHPLFNDCSMLKNDYQLLADDFHSLSKNSMLQKLENVVKRARLVKVYALLISELQRQSKFFSSEKIFQNMSETLAKLQVSS